MDIKGATLIFTPATKLKYETSYYLESDYEIADAIGNTVDAPLNISFTTQDAPILAIDAPYADQTLSGIAVITGTASKEVEQVLVSIADSGYVEANGTVNWSLTVDTSIYNDGLTNIHAKATNGQWDISEQSIQISIQNIDPMVGEWSCIKTYDSGQVNNATTQIFFSSGGMNDALFSCFVSGWSREGDKVVVRRSNCSDHIFTPSFSENNSKLSFRIDEGFAFSAACTRQ